MEQGEDGEDAGDEVEGLIKKAVFELAGGEKGIGNNDGNGANPAENIVDFHKHIIAQK